MRVKAFALLVLAAASVTALQALPAISDSVDVKIDEWMTPSKPAYPHDPAVAPDGSIWYTAQRASTIGRFDPATDSSRSSRCRRRTPDRMVSRRTRTATSGTRGTPRGSSARSTPRPARSPSTRCRTRRPRDPHTIAFLQDGRLFFTVQAGNFIGTLDPEGAERRHQAGRIADRQLAAVRRPPDSKGVPFFDEFNSNKIASADPKTLVITRVPAAQQGGAAAAHRHRQGRHGVVRRLRARLPGPPRSEDRQGGGVRVARRPRLQALRDRRHVRRRRSGTSRPETRRRTCSSDSTPRRRSS